MEWLFLIGWYLAWVALSIIGLVICHALSKKLEPSDYWIGRLFGFSIFSAGLWVIGYTHLIPLTSFFLCAALIAVTLFSLWYLYHHKKVHLNWRSIIMSECVFIALIAIFLG